MCVVRLCVAKTTKPCSVRECATIWWACAECATEACAYCSAEAGACAPPLCRRARVCRRGVRLYAATLRTVAMCAAIGVVADAPPKLSRLSCAAKACAGAPRRSCRVFRAPSERARVRLAEAVASAPPPGRSPQHTRLFFRAEAAVYASAPRRSLRECASPTFAPVSIFSTDPYRCANRCRW